MRDERCEMRESQQNRVSGGVIASVGLEGVDGLSMKLLISAAIFSSQHILNSILIIIQRCLLSHGRCFSYEWPIRVETLGCSSTVLLLLLLLLLNHRPSEMVQDEEPLSPQFNLPNHHLLGILGECFIFDH